MTAGDTVATRMLNLPAPVQSGGFEDSPSLSDDGRFLSFVSARVLVTPTTSSWPT